MPKEKKHNVYIVKCADKTLYTGYTIDIERRVKEHNSTNSKTKYTRVRQPVKLVYTQKFDTKEDALKYEHKIKKLTREQKENLIKQPNQISLNN